MTTDRPDGDESGLATDGDGERASAAAERRRLDRITAAVVTELVLDDKPHMAMLHDLSGTGALVLTRTRVQVGERVELRIHLGGSLEETVTTRGEIVRVEPWAGGESFWPLSVAVRFDAMTTGHEERLQAIRTRQEELGLLPVRS